MADAYAERSDAVITVPDDGPSEPEANSQDYIEAALVCLKTAGFWNESRADFM